LRCAGKQKNISLNPLSCAFGFAGGLLPHEDDVKNCKLFEPQASFCDLVIESEQVAEKAGAQLFLLRLSADKRRPAAANARCRRNHQFGSMPNNIQTLRRD